jgi:hypothetical protein
MMNWLIAFLPADKKALLKLMLRITNRLDTAAERKAVAVEGLEMMADGKVTVAEWAKFGSKLGVLRGKGRPSAPRD